MVYKKRKKRMIKGIQLSMTYKQKNMTQYANNTSFILHREEWPIHNLISILELFSLVVGLKIKWSKSTRY